MCIIDRYLLRKFAATFLICFVSIWGLFVVVDLFTNLDEFVRCGRNAGGVFSFIVHYYAYKTLMIFDFTSGILMLASAMFTVAWIQRHNEMTALMAAGVPRIRVLAPIIGAVAVVSLFSAANREIVIPQFREEIARRPQDPAGNKPQALDTRYDGRTDVLLSGVHTFADRKRIETPDFGLPILLRDYGKRVTADNAYYHPPTGKRPGGYLFEGVHEPKNLATRPSLLLNGEPVLITPHDAPEWLKPDQCFVASDVAFDQLTAGGNTRQLSSTLQLIRGLHNPSLNYKADVRVEVHARFVKPLLDMTLLFLGLPLIVTRESRNVFLAMGICMGVTVLFMIVEVGAQFLGGSSLISPSLAAWLPLMLFVPVAVGLAGGLWR